MSAIDFITATPPSNSVTARKFSASQTAATAQPESATNDSSATISQAAKDLVAKENKIVPYSDDPRAAAKFMQHMAEGFAGKNQARA